VKRILLLLAGLVSTLLGTPNLAREVNVTVSSTTSNCRDASAQEHRVCLSPGERIIGEPTVDVLSHTGRFDIIRWFIDKENPGCYVIQTRVEPVGEDCFDIVGLIPSVPKDRARSVCICRGRGALELRVKLLAGE
jgi:hypothetical protein